MQNAATTLDTAQAPYSRAWVCALKAGLDLLRRRTRRVPDESFEAEANLGCGYKVTFPLSSSTSHLARDGHAHGYVWVRQTEHHLHHSCLQSTPT